MFIVELWDYDDEVMFDLYSDLTLTEALEIINKMKETVTSYYDYERQTTMNQRYISHNRLIRKIGSQRYKGYQLFLQAYPA
ncbi:hypothetical protein [Bacillus sp. REN10]|uniref:hypothetical protein n=1 Tax=Bacillus sp. REN10 TaxID=2782541 RepID=UPI00193AFA02|nr:hypothetical protein [Bacillus sp. REN10]